MINRLEKLYHGACFYPELWDDNVIRKDIEIMKQTGINMVRIGEFMWSKLEPHKGEIDTSFITYILDLLHENDIRVIMCTPTPTPPIWVTHNHPERLHVDSKGNSMLHGSRQHACTNNYDFRAESRNIVEHVAKEVGNHPAVILWQLDNEFKCHIQECYCESCKHQWHQWLEERYKTIENLNKEWGTMIWSELYESFDQVPQPFEATPFIHSSSMSTMYRLFHREKIAEFADEQAKIIRKYSKAPITTNAGMGFAIDNERLFKNLDMVGYDTYASQKMYYAFTINADIWRGIKKDRNFWLLETSASHAGALDRHSEPHPNDYLVSEAVSCFALGSASFTYWLWRQQEVGCEINHSAVLTAWGKPGIGYNNVLKVEEARKEIEDFIVSTDFTQGELAMTYSDRARVFMEVENHKKDGYRGLMTDLYNNILKTGIHRDLIPENMDLEGYKMLMTPFMYSLSDSYVERAIKFVENGGIWLVGPTTGGRTEEHRITTNAALCKRLEEIAGVEAGCPYPMENSSAMGEAFGITAPLKMWSVVFDLKDAEAIGYTRGGVTPNMPFITEKKVGKGKIVMIGSMPYGEDGDKMWQKIISHYGKEAGITVQANTSEGTIAIPRHDYQNNYFVVVNMDGKGGKINLPNGGFDVIKSTEIKAGPLDISPYQYKIIKMN